MITELTPEQKQLMEDVKQEWIDLLFSCKTKINKKVVEEKVKWLYKFSDLKEPIVIFTDSPYECQQTAQRLRKESGINDDSYISFSSYGNIWDFGWVAYYDYFTRLGEIDNPNFNNFKEMLQGGVYDMIQLEQYCIVCALPTQLTIDDSNKLHNETTAAIRFNDGYELYYWHGINIPKQWILNKESITRTMVMEEKNVEKKRCIQEILGSEKYAQLLGVECIDTDFEYYEVSGENKTKKYVRTDKELGSNVVKFPIELFKTKEKDEIIDDYIYFLNVHCPSTDRKYFLCVPSCKTVWEAKAWTFKKDINNFKPILES